MSYTLQDVFTTVPNGYSLIGTGSTVHNPLIGGTYQLLPGSVAGSIGQVQSGYAYCDNTTANSNLFVCNTVAAASANEVGAIVLELQNLGSATNSVQVALIDRATTADYYFLNLVFTTGNSSATAYHYNGGADTPLGTACTGITWTAGLYTIQTAHAGNSLAWQIQRQSDGLWLQTNGTWASTQVSCVTATDSSLPNAGFTGFRLATIPYGTQIAGVQSITSGTAGGALTAGSLTVGAVSSSSITATQAAATGGTPAYTYTMQIAPDVSGSPGTYANSGTPTVNQAYTFTGLTGGSWYWIRCHITDTASGSVYSTAVRVRVLILITPAQIRAVGGLGFQQWYTVTGLTGAQCCNASGAEVACTLSSTGNLNILLSTADTAATHSWRYSIEKQAYTNLSITNAAPNLVVLYQQTAASVPFAMDLLTMGGTDWYGTTSTPSRNVFMGLEVDYGCTVSASVPALPTGKALTRGDSFVDSGSSTAAVSMGQTISYALETFGGQQGVPGSGWAQGALNFPGGSENWITNYETGISRLSGGAWIETPSVIVLIFGRNDNVDVTTHVNATIAALRAVSTTIPIVVFVHPALCGGYPPTSLSATTTASAVTALIAGGATNLSLVTPPGWISNGLEQGVNGLSSGATTSLTSSGLPHLTPEFAQKVGAWIAKATAVATASGGSAVYPPASGVLTTAGAYGPTGSNYTGTVTLPPASTVLTSQTFGPGSATTGTVVLPSVSTVEAGITYGPGSSLTGTYSAGGGGGGVTLAQLNASLASNIVTLAPNGLDQVVTETGLNIRQATSLMAAALAGVLTGAGTGTITIQGAGVAATRITATTDYNGNRSSVTLNIPS